MQNHPALIPLLEQLRSSTRVLHDRAERAMDIMSPSLNKECYTEKLGILFNFYRALQSRLSQTNQTAHNVVVPIDRLSQDLVQLTGVPPKAAPVAGADEYWAALGDFHFRVGVFYVLEGSALGGQIVSRHLGQSLGLTPANGTAYFYGDGPRVQQEWPRKIAGLGEYDQDPAAHARILAGAEQTFLIFIRLFS